MYKRSQYLTELDDSIVVWRYMTLASFVDILNKRCLRFRKASSFPDLYDCYVSLDDTSKEAFLKALDCDCNGDDKPNIVTKAGGLFNPYIKNGELTFMLTTEGDDIITNADLTFCSCWHENDFESYAMWKIYLSNNPEGIAIKSTVGRLKSALRETEYDVYIGRADYCSTGISLFDNSQNEHNVILRKKKEYDYEREIRIFFSLLIDDCRDIDVFSISIDLDCLIDEVWISPFWEWGDNCVKGLLLQFGLDNIKIQSSNIKEK